MAGLILRVFHALGNRVLATLRRTLHPSSMLKGFYAGIAYVVALAVLFMMVWTAISTSWFPSPETLRSFAETSATLLLAFIGTSIWLIQHSLTKSGKDDRSAWLAGNLCAYAFCGMLSVIATLGYAELMPSPQAAFVARLGLCTALASISR